VAPLFLIGFFAGHVAPRYVVGFLPFFILVGIAGIVSIVDRLGITRYSKAPLGSVLVTVILVAFFVRPVAFWHNVNPRYADFPSLYGSRGVDHKGAAEYVLSRSLDADDLVMAVDAQVQGYYLGDRLDFYVRSLINTRNSTYLKDGRMLNLYTGTPQIATGEEMERLLADKAKGEVLLIRSGVTDKNPRRYMDDGIIEAIEKYQFREVYVGRDGATKVWQYSVPET
jgi:hypothetical protein